MQQDFESNHPDRQIQLLVVNVAGLESGNAGAANGRDIPLLQDTADANVWSSWDVTWRDVIVVDANSEVVTTFNLTQNNLQNPDNYDDLKQILLDATPPSDNTPDPVAGDCSSDGLVNASDLSCVSDVDGRDVVLDTLQTLPGDFDGNGEVDFADFLVLSANFGNDAASYAEGNVDLKNGVDFADFLELSSNFGKTLQAAPATASSIDEAFGEWEANDED